jgi:hypothetical protein
MIVSPEVTTADTGGLVQKLAGVITMDYGQRNGVNDPVISVKIYSSPSDVAGVLALLQSVQNLWGAMLIGNVPTPWDDPNNLTAQVSNGKLLKEFKANDIAGLQKMFMQSAVKPKIHFVVRKNSTSAAYPANAVAFDAPYKAPNCSGYVLGAGGEIMQFADPSSPDPNCVKKNWVSRIISNNSVDEVLQFIQKDINTRHSNAPLQKYGFVRAAWFGGLIDPDHNAYWVNNALYAADDVSYVDNYGSADNTSTSRLQDILNLLEDGTEFVAIDVHGGPDEVTIEGAGTVGTFYSSDAAYLTPDQLYQLPNHARIINMISCGTGNFLYPGFTGYAGYFAGAALFGGDALLVVANTPETAIFGSYEEEQVEKKYHLLANGATFGDIDMSPDDPNDMFGDPTISLRPQKTGGPILSVSTDGMNFSRYHGPLMNLDVSFAKGSVDGVKSQQAVTLRNDGSGELALQLTMMPEDFGVDGNPISSGSLGITLDSPVAVSVNRDTDLGDVVFTVPAGGTLDLTYGLSLVNDASTGAPLYGTYSALYQIHSVDPRDSSKGGSDPRLGRINLFLSGNVSQ